MTKRILLLSSTLIFSIILFFSNCQREIDVPVDTTGNNVVNDNIMVVASVRGTVVDENNQPVSGATVTAGVSTTTTDTYGIFKFKNINLSKENGYVKVNKPGYFTGSKSFVTTTGVTHNIRLKLLPKLLSGTFNAATGGSVSINGGGKLVMPAAGVADASGNAFTGTVNVSMTWIDPSASNLPEIMVGDLRGITTSGEERGLQTFGMLGVELTSSTGLPLNIASGKTAELTFPIPASMAGNAPATIDLWHFDETKGRWKQEGTATKTGTNYIAQVSHFSFWNCDAPFPLITLCMSFVNASNNQPLINTQIRIVRANGLAGYGWTDSTGSLCGKVPKNETLTLQVIDQCNNVVYSQNIGPFSANASLATISVAIPAANSLTFTGTITNCAGNNVASGSAVIYTNGAFSYNVPVTNGTFTATIIRCSNTPINYSIIGIDFTAMQQSVPVGGTASTGTVNVGTIQACGTSSSQFIEFIVDGTPYNFVTPPDVINAFDSTGTWGAYTNNTTVSATQVTGGSTTTGTYFNFLNDQVVGNVPLQNVSLYLSPAVNAQQVLTTNPMVNITAFGSTGGGFIVGNFSIQMMFGNTPKNVVCNFRVRRN